MECSSIRSGASGLPYYCTPLVCISDVIGLLTVWRHNKPKPKNQLLLRMCVVFYSSFVCMSAYANVQFKTKLRECLRAGLPPGSPRTAHPPVCVSAVLGALAVWIARFFFPRFFFESTELACRVQPKRTPLFFMCLSLVLHS